MEEHHKIYRTTEDGGVQLAANADRWYLYEDYVHLSPHHTEGQLYKFDAELKPFVDNPDHMALVITDMQNDFCAEGGWTQTSGLDHEGCRNTDQCVTTTMEDTYFHDYNAILLENATSTSSPGYCKDAVVFNAKNCWGFSTTTERFANARPFEG